MSQISSINFKKSFAINTEHNDRTLPPNYLIDNEKGAHCNRTAFEARELKNQIIDEAMQSYAKNTKQKFQAKSYEWSAVCNIKPDTTMQDLEKLAEHFNQKYGFQCYQIAIHRDEGHIDENGEKQINHHAHLEFITLDKDTGINRQREIKPHTLRQIQDETADILKMQRGQDKRLSGAKRIEPRQYAQLKEQEKANTKELKNQIQAKDKEILSNKEIKEKYEAERQKNKNQGFTAEFFKDLNARKKNALEDPDYTKEKLEKDLQELYKKHTQKGLLTDKIDYKALSQEQTQIIIQRNEQVQTLTKIIIDDEKSKKEQIEYYVAIELKEQKFSLECEIHKQYQAQTKIKEQELEKQIEETKKIKENLSVSSVCQEIKTEYENKITQIENEKSEIQTKLEAEKEKNKKLEQKNSEKEQKLQQEKQHNFQIQTELNTSNHKIKILKTRNNELESDLNAEKQKNDKSQAKNISNENLAVSDIPSDTNQNNQEIFDLVIEQYQITNSIDEFYKKSEKEQENDLKSMYVNKSYLKEDFEKVINNNEKLEKYKISTNFLIFERIQKLAEKFLEFKDDLNLAKQKSIEYFKELNFIYSKKQKEKQNEQSQTKNKSFEIKR